MADLGGAGSGPGELASLHGGMFGPLARSQYGAMARLRWEIFRSGLRSIHGVFDLGAAGITWLVYAFLGLLLGAGAGAATYFLVSGGHWRALPILFWVLMFLWQMIPIMLASFQQQFDLGILLRFPVRFGSYYLLYLVFGLLDISTVLGGIACVGIFVGVAVAAPALLVWTTLALAVFAAFNILLVRAIFAWIERWLAQRRTREILGAVFMVGLLSLQILNPALYRKNHSGHSGHMAQMDQFQAAKARYAPMLKPALAVERWLPPGLAAQSLQQAVAGLPGAGIASLGMLGLYAVLAGGVLGLRLGKVYRGENLGVAPGRTKAGASRSKAAASAGVAGVAALDRGAAGKAGGGPIAAIMEKDVRSLLRTLPLLYAIGAPLLLVLVFSTMFIKNGGVQAPVFPLALPICMVYAQLGFTQIFYNNLGTEGAGVQLYFLSPTPMRTVLLAKNLLHAGLFAVVALVAGLLAALRLGIPDAMVIAATAAWVLFSLPCNLAAGNLFSLKMPYRVNPGRITRQRGSQGNALLSLLVQLAFLAVGAAVFSLSWFLGKMWLAVPIFLLLAAGAVVVWYQVLGTANDVANERRTELMAALMKES
jgi:ABC-2 type transport system permease protein